MILNTNLTNIRSDCQFYWTVVIHLWQFGSTAFIPVDIRCSFPDMAQNFHHFYKSYFKFLLVYITSVWRLSKPHIQHQDELNRALKEFSFCLDGDVQANLCWKIVYHLSSLCLSVPILFSFPAVIRYFKLSVLIVWPMKTACHLLILSTKGFICPTSSDILLICIQKNWWCYRGRESWPLLISFLSTHSLNLNFINLVSARIFLNLYRISCLFHSHKD